MTQANFSVDQALFGRQLRQLAKEYGFEAKTVMQDQARLWGIDLCDFTYPRGNTNAAKQPSEKQIRSGMNSIFVRMDSSEALRYFAERFGGLTRSGKVNKKKGAMLESHAEGAKFNLNGDAPAMRAWIKQHRTGKNKRVSYRAHPVAVAGKFVIVSAMYAPRRAVERETKRAITHIGMLKAGWLAGIEHFASAVRAPITSRQVPRFVRQAANLIPGGHRVAGGFEDAMKPNGDGYLALMNTVPWNADIRGLVAATGKKREKDMAEHLEQRIARLARQREREDRMAAV